MEIKIHPDHETLSRAVAGEILRTVEAKPNAVLCFASGETPRRACELLAAEAKSRGIGFSKITFLGLDEWVGVPPENDGSCRFFFKNLLFGPLGLRDEQWHLFDALAADLPTELRKMDARIAAAGGIDLMLVGIGMNGHIGFNEPGTPFDALCHVAELDETTRSVGQKYFREAIAIERGITVGLGQLMASRRVILMANGEKKAEIVGRALRGEVSERVPSSVLQRHPGGVAMLDFGAAKNL